MKRLLILVAVLITAALPTFAQSQADIITLNDATPAIDVAISLPANATGTISLNLAMAAVTIKDDDNNVVFYAADERMHGLDFNIAPNSGPHTLTVERLPGHAEASVSVISLPELAMGGVAQLIPGNVVSLNQETNLSLSVDNPGDTVAVNIPEGTTGVVTTTFPGASATTQLVDNNGILIAQSSGGHIDGMSFVLDAGDYNFTILGSNFTEPIIAGVRAISSDEAGVEVMEAPIAPAETAAGANCMATILYSSVNLRSGPGTGYSVLDYGFHGETLPIGGQNPQSNWVVVATEDGNSAWVSRSTISMEGSCAELAVFDIPLRDAQPAQIIISAPSTTNPAPVVNNNPAPSNTTNTTTYHDDDDHDEGEHDGEHEEHDD